MSYKMYVLPLIFLYVFKLPVVFKGKAVWISKEREEEEIYDLKYGLLNKM